MSDNLDDHFKSWMDHLRDMADPEVPKLLGRLGCTPFTTMGLTKNFWAYPHLDPEDCTSSFILWFEKGKYLYLT